ncbi:MAG: PAS domain S-box protein, partial [Rhodobacteraceae bacterium]|nr:PAS domain S-box protein [Paracoccaceae bacterium]
PATGVLVALLALAGEGVDVLALRRIAARHPEGIGPVGAGERRLAVATAAFQALTIAACVVIGWAFVPHGDSRFFAATFLIGTAINAGVVRPFHPASTDARLAIYALTLIGLAGHDMFWATPPMAMSPGQGLFLVGALMMALLTAAFMDHVARTHAARTRFEHDLLREKHRLALSQVALESQMDEIRRLAAVAENSNDSVSILDDDGNIRWVNRTFERLTGYALHEVLGKPLETTLYAATNPPETLAMLRAARSERHAVRAEVLVCHRDGREIWFDSARSPMTDAAGRPIGTLVVGREITEAKTREAELARAREAAEAAARARAQFLATMSHEIRTPMNGVIATAELLADTPLDPDQARYVATIVDSGHALLTIINDILDLSRLQSGQPVLNARAFELDDCLRAVVDLLRPEAARRGLELRLEIDGRAGRVVGDDGRLRQIVLNLVGNALKFTEAGHVAVGARTAPGSGGLCRIEIAVADTGIGIPPDRLDTVFDSFTQADGEIGRRYGGTGLGLTISRLIARQMGGDITATSRPGEGSRFVLTL